MWVKNTVMGRRALKINPLRPLIQRMRLNIGHKHSCARRVFDLTAHQRAIELYVGSAVSYLIPN